MSIIASAPKVNGDRHGKLMTKLLRAGMLNIRGLFAFAVLYIANNFDLLYRNPKCMINCAALSSCTDKYVVLLYTSS